MLLYCLCLGETRKCTRNHHVFNKSSVTLKFRLIHLVEASGCAGRKWLLEEANKTCTSLGKDAAALMIYEKEHHIGSEASLLKTLHICINLILVFTQLLHITFSICWTPSNSRLLQMWCLDIGEFLNVIFPNIVIVGIRLECPCVPLWYYCAAVVIIYLLYTY